jgi:hypothetical protein
MAEASRAWGPRMGGNHQCHRAALGGTTRLDGALYSLWTNLKGLWMARSRDRGESWKMWQVLGSDEVLYFPYLVAGPRPNELAGPVTRSAGGEYLGMTFLREGGFAVVTPIFNGETKRAGFSWWKADIRERH